MKFGLALLFFVACISAALAQYGVSNQRDRYGNLIRNGGPYSDRGVNQGPVNHGAVRNAPAQPPTANLGANRNSGQVGR